MLGQLYSLSSSMYTVPALHDEGRAAVQGDAESSAWLKQWDPSLEALWHLHPWRRSRLVLQSWAICSNFQSCPAGFRSRSFLT